MKALAISTIGFEGIVALEVQELTGSKGEVLKGAVLFEAEAEKVIEFCYLTQSAVRVIELVYDGELKDIEDILRSSDFGALKGKQISVDCYRIGEHEFNSQDVRTKLAGRMKAEGHKIDFDNFKARVYVYIVDDHYYSGVDLIGFDLDKRDYKIFNNPRSLKGNVAYCLVRRAGIKEGVLLDPFSGGGEVAVEAAAWQTGRGVNYYRRDKLAFSDLEIVDTEKFFAKMDKKIGESGLKIICSDTLMRNVDAAKKNAKVAGVNKAISFSRMDIDWLDTKFDEKSVDCIVGNAPYFRENTERKGEKFYDTFFNQAKYLLAKKGCIVLATRAPDVIIEAAKVYGFKAEQSVFCKGKEEMFVLVMKKN